MVKAGQVVLMFLGLLLAGCSGPPAVPTGIPVDAHGAALPTIEGIVVDEAVRPLPGAQVRFLGTSVNATTDAAGHYAILRPTLRAEAVLVTASKAGYVSRTAQAQVSGHRSTRIDFGLVADPSVVPHVDVLQHRGTAGCDAVVLAAGQRLGQGCADDQGQYEWEGERSTAPASIWDVTPTPGFAGAVLQVVWQAATPASTDLHVRLRGPTAGGQPAPVLAEATGPSPLRLEVPAPVARTFSAWTGVRVYVELAPTDGMPASAASGQPFDAFASLFYVDAAPPGYTLS